MGLEDWEKELKAQLDDKVAPQPEAPKVQNTIEKPKPTSPPVKVEQVQEGGNWLMIVMLFVLAATTLWVYDSKTGYKIKESIESMLSYKQEEKREPISPDAEVAKIKTDLEKYKSENKSTIDAIQAKLNTNSTKIGLMGLLLNENFTMIMRGADASDFVFFNRDWTLDRLPKYIELTEDDKEYLKKYINQKD